MLDLLFSSSFDDKLEEMIDKPLLYTILLASIDVFIIFSILAIAHELGHFLACLILGIETEIFIGNHEKYGHIFSIRHSSGITDLEKLFIRFIAPLVLGFISFILIRLIRKENLVFKTWVWLILIICLSSGDLIVVIS